MLLFVFAGCVLGMITGLIPGLHSNTVSFLMVALVKTQDFNVSLAVVAMNVVQAFVDFVPNIMIGAPDSGNFVSVLPGHYFFLRGEGMHAIRLSVAGGIIAALASVPVSAALFLFLAQTENFFPKLMPLLLFIVIVAMVMRANSPRKQFFSLAVVLMSGALGLISMRSANFGDMLFPLITGFFGVAGILYSMNSSGNVIEQGEEGKEVDAGKIATSSLLGVVAAALISIMPSIGPNQAAIIAKEIKGKVKRSEFLVMAGSIAVANVVFGLIVLFAVGKIRSGAAAAVRELGGVGIEQLLVIFAIIIFSAGVGAVAAELLGRKVAAGIRRISYNKINFTVLGFMVAAVFIFNGFIGLLVLIVASSIGILAVSTKTNRSCCMAALMLPTIMFYLGL
jgi:putative membrane protein